MSERISRLKAYSGGGSPLIYASLVLSALSAALTVVPFYYIWLVLEEVISVMPDFSLAADVVYNAWMAVLFTVLSVLIYMAGLLCSHRASFRVTKNMRKALLRKVGSMPPGTYDMMGSGTVRRTIQDCTESTETFIAHIMPDMVGSMVLPLAILVMLFLFDWRLGIASLAVVILGFAVMMTMMNNKELADSMMSYQGELGNINKEAVEYIRGISVVKTFQQTVDTFQEFRESILGYSAFVTKYAKWCRSRMVLFVVLANFGFGALILTGLAVNGGLVWTPEFLSDFLFYIIFTPIIPALLLKVMYSGEESYVVDDALMRVGELMDAEPLPEPEVPAEPADMTLRFEDVSFSYPGSERKALDSLSLTLAPGTVTALVGASGSGKSTAAGLACRFWDPQDGRITLGGKDLRDIGSRRLAELTGFVFQDSRLIKDTLRNNVRLGRPDATDEAVMSALDAAQCSDIVAKMPDGLDTLIGPGGTYLSGGEVQRVAIARVILKDPRLVVLDEATAFADPENEYLVQKALARLSEDRTVLMIAHRLTTVRDADQICVMDNGNIRESGTHETLMAGQGRYRSMWDDYQESLSWKVTG